MAKTQSAETCFTVINHISTEKFVNSKKKIEVLIGSTKSYLLIYATFLNDLELITAIIYFNS